MPQHLANVPPLALHEATSPHSLIIAPSGGGEDLLHAGTDAHCLRRYFPPVKSEMEVTPAWEASPSSKDVTILFTFIENWTQLKRWERSSASSVGVLSYCLELHDSLVSWPRLPCTPSCPCWLSTL